MKGRDRHQPPVGTGVGCVSLAYVWSEISAMNFIRMLKLPSAFVPLAMSCAALITVLLHLRLSGVAQEADEGAAAHIFQMLIVAQIPFAAFFAWRFVPLAPKSAITVILLQVCAVVIAIFPVWWLTL